MSKRTLALIVVLLAITSFLLVLALSPQKPANPYSTSTTGTSIKPSPTPNLAFTTLSLTPNPVTVSPTSSSGSVDVAINTGENKVTAVQLEISYDPKVLSDVNITPPVGPSSGSFFDNPVPLVKRLDPQNGTISYALGISPKGIAKKGSGTVATISFKVIGNAPQTTSMTFLPKTLVTAEGVSQTVLKESIGTKITLTAQ